MRARVIYQAVSRRSPTAKAQVLSQSSPYGNCVGRRDTGQGFSPSTSVFRCQHHSTNKSCLFSHRRHYTVLALDIVVNIPTVAGYSNKLFCSLLGCGSVKYVKGSVTFSEGHNAYKYFKALQHFYSEDGSCSFHETFGNNPRAYTVSTPVLLPH